ncbi:ATPase-like protein [Calothrix sp. NIES-4101]|nr:ATPase-like protein [Calothrix sp. NIES-4101]
MIHEARKNGWEYPRKSEKSRLNNVANQITEGEFYPVYNTVEQTILEHTFSQNWITFKSAFHRYHPEPGYWQFVESEEICKLIATDLKRCCKLDARSGEYKFNFFKNNNLKSAFGICNAALALSINIQNQHLIAFQNGTYNIETKTLEPHSRENYLTWGVDADYVEQESCPEVFKNFITKVFGLEFLDLIRALISMYVDPSAPYGYFIHLIGDSGSGKGTFLRFLGSLLNTKNVRSIAHFSELQSPEARHQHLTGVKLCICPDSKAFQGNMTAFYELVDNGTYSGRALYSSDGYEKRWNVRFALASTNYLAIENAGDGWQRRCIPIPTKSREGEVDLNLGEKLENCKAGVIAWALGMPAQERNQLIKNSSSVAGVADLKSQQSVFADTVKGFIDSCLHPNAEAKSLSGQELFDVYKQYCLYAGHKPKALTNFLKDLGSVLSTHKVGGHVKKEEGKSKRVPVSWERIGINDGLFESGNGLFHPEKLVEGGLEAFESSHNGGLRLGC